MTRISGPTHGAIANSLGKATFTNAALGLGLLTAAASPGDLDATFGTDGKVTTALGSGNDWGRSVATQPDGKILVAGYSFNGSNNDFALVRYLSDGSLDTAFGSGGKVTTSIGASTDEAYKVAVQPDGKIVVAGNSFDGSTYNFAVVRYTDSGALDTSFNGTGKVTTPIGGGHDFGHSVAVQADGRIVMAGYVHNGSNNDFGLVRYLADGSLDASFGTGGKVIVPIGSSTDEAFSVAVQPDGKIVVGGNSFDGSTYNFAVVRLTDTGGLDLTFNGTGKVTTSVGSGHDFGHCVALQGDGGILLAGYSHNGSNNDFALVRYLSDGSLDTTFGSGGKVTTPIGGSTDEAYGVAVQSDGKIVLGGSSFDGSTYNLAVVRYTGAGALDTTFNGTGKTIMPIGGGHDFGHSMKVQADGAILLGGYASNGANEDFALARLLGDPVVAAPEIHVTGNSVTIPHSDTTPRTADHSDFGGAVVSGGSVTQTFTVHNTGSLDLMVTSVAVSGAHAGDFTVGALSPAGPVAAGGSATFALTFDPSALGTRTATITVNSDDADEAAYEFAIHGTGANPGSLDVGFGTGGKVTTDFNGLNNLNEVAWGVAVQADGKIVVSGNVGSGSTEDFAVARYHANGTLDTSFGTGGKVVTPIGSGQDRGRAGLVIQPDGKIVLGGHSNISGSLWNMALVRYHPDGTLDTSFGAGGKATATGGSGNGFIGYAMALQGDGKFLVGGFTGSAGSYDFVLARFNSDGSLDTSFGSAGSVITSIGGDDIASGMTVQSDGKIVLVGQSWSGGNSDFVVVRYTTSGALDSTFDGDGKLATPIGGGGDFASSVRQLADGRLVVAGHTHNGSSCDVALVRYHGDGSLDTTFGSEGTGKVVTPTGGSGYDESIVVQADGRIVVAGEALNGGNSDFLVVRYLADGTLDPSFDTDGIATIPIGGSYDIAQGVALQADGHIVAAGFADNGTTTDFALVRYVSDAVVAAPEIHVTSNGTLIPDGDTTPSPDDDTDFGGWSVDRGGLALVFSIHNTGTAPLNISLKEVIGPHAIDFSPNPLTPSGPIAAGGFASFSITFDPSVVGLRTATFRIHSDDADEAVYDFAIQGTGLPNAAPNVTGEALSRPNTTRLVKVRPADLLANDTDPDLDELTVVAVGNALPAGSTVALTGGFIVYSAPANAAGDGSFEYTVSDGAGHLVNGLVTLTETGAPPANPPANAVKIGQQGDDYRIWFIGIPGRRYRVEWTADLTPPRVWEDFFPPGLHIAPANGVFQHLDESPPEEMRLYRAVPAPEE